MIGMSKMDPATLREIERRVNRRAALFASRARELDQDPLGTAYRVALWRCEEASLIAALCHAWARRSELAKERKPPDNRCGCGRNFRTAQGLGLHLAWLRRADHKKQAAHARAHDAVSLKVTP